MNPNETMEPTDPNLEPPVNTPVEPDDFKAMMIGATCIFVVAFIPFASLACCLPQIFGAVLALHLFTSQYRLTLAYGDAIKLGILTVLIGAFASWLVAMLLLMTTGYQVGHEIMELMIKWFKSIPSMAQAVPQMEEAMAKQKAEGLKVTNLLIGAVSLVVMSGVSGTLGGVLGAAMFKRGPKPE